MWGRKSLLVLIEACLLQGTHLVATGIYAILGVFVAWERTESREGGCSERGQSRVFALVTTRRASSSLLVRTSLPGTCPSGSLSVFPLPAPGTAWDPTDQLMPGTTEVASYRDSRKACCPSVSGSLGFFRWEDHHKFCSIHLELVSDQQEFKNTFVTISQQLKLQGLNKG